MESGMSYPLISVFLSGVAFFGLLLYLIGLSEEALFEKGHMILMWMMIFACILFVSAGLYVVELIV